MIPLEPLTDREQAAFALLVRGLTGQEVADKLSMSRRTVEGYRANILRKYGVRKMVQLAGLVPSEDFPTPPPTTAAMLEILHSVRAMQEQLRLIEARVEGLLDPDKVSQPINHKITSAMVPQRRQRRRLRPTAGKRS